MVIDGFRPEDKTHTSQTRNTLTLNPEKVIYKLSRHIGLSVITQM